MSDRLWRSENRIGCVLETAVFLLRNSGMSFWRVDSRDPNENGEQPADERPGQRFSQESPADQDAYRRFEVRSARRAHAPYGSDKPEIDYEA